MFIEVGNSTVLPGEANPYPSGWGLDVRVIYSPLSSVCLLDNPPSWHVGYRGNPRQLRAGLSFFESRSSSPEWFDNSSSYVAPSASSWLLYEDEVVAARFDANNSSTYIYRLARAYSRSDEDFYATLRASISRDGKYIAYGSNMAYAHTGCPANFLKQHGMHRVYLTKIH